MLKINRFPMRTLIFEPRAGGGVYGNFDRVGLFKKDKGLGFEYKIKKKKKTLDPQRYSNIIETNKGKLLLLWNPTSDVFESMRGEEKKIEVEKKNKKDNPETYKLVKVKGFELSADEISWKENFMNNVEKAYSLFMRQSFLQKYMPLIMLIVFGFIMIMALYVVRQDIATLVVQAASATGTSVSQIGAVTPPIPGLG